MPRLTYTSRYLVALVVLLMLVSTINVTYMVMPVVTTILFSVVPPEPKSTSISISNAVLNLVIAVVVAADRRAERR